MTDCKKWCEGKTSTHTMYKLIEWTNGSMNIVYVCSLLLYDNAMHWPNFKHVRHLEDEDIQTFSVVDRENNVKNVLKMEYTLFTIFRSQMRQLKYRRYFQSDYYQKANWHLKTTSFFIGFSCFCFIFSFCRFSVLQLYIVLLNKKNNVLGQKFTDSGFF